MKQKCDIFPLSQPQIPVVCPGFYQLVELSILNLPKPAQLWELMPEALCPVIHGWPQPAWAGLFFIFQ